MKDPKSNLEKGRFQLGAIWTLVLLLLGVVHIIPIWSIKYFPSQDGPSHIYNAHAFLQLFQDGNWRLDQVFRQNVGWIPNSLAHLFFVIGQALGFGPFLVEKAFLSLVVIGLPLSIHYVATALSPKNWMVGLVGFILAFHNLLHMGFYSYSASVPLALFFLGAFLRFRFNLTLGRALILIILGHLVFLSHFSSMAILLLLLACLMAVDLVGAFLPSPDGKERRFPTIKAWWRNAILLLAIGAPALVYHLMAGHPGHGTYMGDERLMSLLFDEALLVTYTADHYRIVHWLWWLFALSLLCHILVRLFRRKIWEKSDLFLLMTVALGWLYFDLPNWTHGGGWVNHRPLLFLIIFMWLTLTRFPAWLQAALGCFVLYISLYQLILFERDYQMLQPLLSEYEGVGSHVEPHSTLSRKVTGSHSFPHRSLRVDPFLHAPCYTALGEDMAYVQNYEASHRYFWVNYRHSSRSNRAKPDYQVIWSGAGVSSESQTDYETILQKQHLKLIKLKPKNVSWNGDQPLKLRFSDSLSTGEQRISLYRPWQPGQIGFLEGTALEAANGGVRSLHPNTLRLEIPNGKYRANLVLKGEKKSTTFSIRAGNNLVWDQVGSDAMGYQDSPSFPIEVFNERVDLAFTPLRKKGNSHNMEGYWAIQGLDLFRLDNGDAETGLDLHLEGWCRHGYFDEAIQLNLEHPSGNITYTTNGSSPESTDTLWPKTGLTINASTRLRVRRWIAGSSIAEVDGNFTKIQRFSPDWFLPVDLVPPGSLNGRTEEGPLEGYLKIKREGRYHFRTYGDVTVILAGATLPLQSGDLTEVWLDQGTYSISVTSEEGEPDLFWASGSRRESRLTRQALWLKP